MAKWSRRTARAKLLGTALLVVLAGACGEDVTGEAAPEGTDERTQPAAVDSPQPDPEGDTGDGAVLADDAVPDFTVETFDGDSFTLYDHIGTPVVLEFWESW